jgi:hypothetical protein
LLLDLAAPARKWAEAAQRLQEIENRRAELVMELEILDAEVRDILGHPFSNPEVLALAGRLLQVATVPVPDPSGPPAGDPGAGG